MTATAHRSGEAQATTTRNPSFPETTPAFPETIQLTTPRRVGGRVRASDGRTYLVANGSVFGRPHTRQGRPYGRWGLAYVANEIRRELEGGAR